MLLDAWLGRLLEIVPGSTAGVILQGETPAGPWKLVASLPHGHVPPAALLSAAAMAAESGRPVLRGSEPGHDAQVAAAPLALEPGQHAGVAVALAAQSQAECLAALQTVQAGTAWIPLLVHPTAEGESQQAQFARSVLSLIATCLDPEQFRAAATAAATELATRQRCERVSLGFLARRQIRVVALSHSARFDERSQLVRDLAAAMEEAMDQGVAVLDPPVESTAPLVRHAAERLRSHGAGAVCSIPIAAHGELIGAVCFEAPPGSRFDAGFVTAVYPLLDLIGRILASRWREERWIGAKLWEAARAELETLRDPAHPGRRLALGGVLGVLFLLAVVPTPYRISAPAHLEGSIQRAVVAARDGYVEESRARAGDLVRAGDVLGALDRSELELELRKWEAQRSQRARELRAALAEHDRARLPILRAQLDQADAEVALATELLERTRLVAPFDGIVAKGDLSRALGTSVARGDVLFEIAPLDSYRVILEVDERDIADVGIRQRGTLTLSALPSHSFPFAVERITPVATAENARCFFRVEARLEAPGTTLRPGMEGVGKIEAGWRRTLWIWTHRLFDWLRLWIWARLP